MAEHDGSKILHQHDTESVIDQRLEDSSTQVAIPNVASPGASYVQAEAVATRDAVNKILGVLRDSGLIPSS